MLGALYACASKLLNLEDLDRLIEFSPNGKLISGGDLNAKHADWHSRLIIISGRIIARHVQLNNCPDMPSNDSLIECRLDLIDIFCYHSTLPISNIETLNELNSDHKHVKFTVNVNMTAEIRRNFTTRAINGMSFETT